MTDISIWLLPQKEDEIALQHSIDDLASRYHAYPFLPHITAYYPGSNLILETFLPIMREVAASVNPFVLPLKTIGYSDEFTKTLFASYENTESLQKVYDMFRAHVYTQAPYVMVPHLSLLYAHDISPEQKKYEKTTLRIPPTLCIDRIALITKPGSIIEKERDVLAWQVHTEFFLKK